MFCPYCASEKTEVISTIKGFSTERWRKCKKCGRTFFTEEKPKVDKALAEIMDNIDKENEKKDKLF
jgi:transcriptional repressor NrdR